MRRLCTLLALLALAPGAASSWPSHICEGGTLDEHLSGLVATFLVEHDVDDAEIFEVCVPWYARHFDPRLEPHGIEHTVELRAVLLRAPHDEAGGIRLRRVLHCDVVDERVERCGEAGLRVTVDGYGTLWAPGDVAASDIAALWPIAQRLATAPERVRALVPSPRGDGPLAGYGWNVWVGRPHWCGMHSRHLFYACGAAGDCSWRFDLRREGATSACGFEHGALAVSFFPRR